MDLEQILTPLQERKSELLTMRERLSSQVSELDKEIRTIDKVLRAAFPPPPTEKVRRNGSVGEKRVSDEAVKQVRNAFHSIAEQQEFVTQSEVAELTGLHSTTVSTAFNMLRNDMMIRQAGKQGRVTVWKLTA